MLTIFIVILFFVVFITQFLSFCLRFCSFVLGSLMERIFRILSSFQFARQKQKKSVPEMYRQIWQPPNTRSSPKDVFNFYVRTGFRLMTCGYAASNTEMGVVSDSYRISFTYSVYNFSIRTHMYINARCAVIS